jgi:cell division protein FtsB
MNQKLQEYYKRYSPYVRQLQDVRMAGLVLFVVVVLLVSWSGVKAIDTNYRLQKQITSLAQQNELQSLSNNNLKLQNQYYKSNQYLELNARQNYGLAAPGETELLVSKSAALAHIVPTKQAAVKTASEAQPSWQRNFRAWMDFFLHRPTSN